MGHGDYASTFGERVRLARQQKGWTQVALATSAELTSNYIARLERGEVGVSLTVATRIAQALGITLDDLSPTQSGSRTATRRG